MMGGLNRAYEVREERRWWRVLSIAFGLTISLGVMGVIALGTILYGSRLFPLPWRIIQWLVTMILLLFSFSSLYRFGPNLKNQRWQTSTPGALVAIVLSAGSTLLLRI
jgi:membrane protein